MSKRNRTGSESPVEQSGRDRSTREPKGGNVEGRSGAEVPRSGSDPAPRKGVFGVKGGPAAPGSKDDSRRCTATAQGTGQRCKRAAIKGGNVCTTHGGAAPQVQKSAKERLLELADPAIAALSKIVRDETTDDAVRVRAALGVLDRIGYGPGSKVELEVGLTRFEEALTAAYGGQVIDGKAVFPEGLDRNGGVDRGEMEGPDDRPALGRGVGGDDHWEDLDQAQRDAQAEAWREYDIEDERPYSTRIESPGPVVRGEVVSNDPPDYSRSRR